MATFLNSALARSIRGLLSGRQKALSVDGLQSGFPLQMATLHRSAYVDTRLHPRSYEAGRDFRQIGSLIMSRQPSRTMVGVWRSM